MNSINSWIHASDRTPCLWLCRVGLTLLRCVVAIMVAMEECSVELKIDRCPHLKQLLDALKVRLCSLFELFIDDQIRAIVETKVSVKRRGGILPFMRTVPVIWLAANRSSP